MRIEPNIVDEFAELQKRLPQILSEYGMKHVHIYTNLPMSRSGYTKKLQRAGFTADEMRKIIEIINR